MTMPVQRQIGFAFSGSGVRLPLSVCRDAGATVAPAGGKDLLIQATARGMRVKGSRDGWATPLVSRSLAMEPEQKPRRMPNVLVIDDDVELSGLLVEYLEGEGFSAEGVHDGAAGLDAALSGRFDIVVLDVMMPGTNGFQVLAATREASAIPVLMLTARGGDDDRILGLEKGADDYVPKPCQPREIVARLRAILKRTANGLSASSDLAQASLDIVVGDLCLRPLQQIALIQGREVDLTKTEFTMLQILAGSAGHPVSRVQLCEEALGRPLDRFDRSIDVHICNIRQKLGPLADGRPRIRAAVRKGYRYVSE